MSDSPAVILYDINGNEVTVRDGYVLSPDQSFVPVTGVDADGYARVIKVEADGSTSVTNAVRTKRYDAVSNTLTYLGSAEVGSLESDSVWTITALVTTAQGDPVSAKVALNVAWDNRTTATYL
jgi:hypothetical protein